MYLKYLKEQNENCSMERIEASYYTCIEGIPVHRNMISFSTTEYITPERGIG
jgi:hypothetical protein